jgi:nucleoid-associated protein YgaU
MSSEYDIEKYDREREERIKHLETLKEQAEEEFNSYHNGKRESFENRDNFEYEYAPSHAEEDSSAKKRLIAVASVVLLGVAGYFGYNSLSGDGKSNDSSSKVAVSETNTTSQKGDVRDKIESIVSTAMKKQESAKSEGVDVSKMVAQNRIDPKSSRDSADEASKRENSSSSAIVESGEEGTNRELVSSSKETHIASHTQNGEHKGVKRVKKRPNFIVVRVRKGDTLASIAERFYGNPMYYKRILRANKGLRRGTHLRVGQRIIVPELDKKIRDRLYRIRKGDTLYKISKRFYGTTKKVQKIIDANYKIKSASTKLNVGDLIYIPK